MIDGDDWTAADETAASLISSKALVHALLTTLQDKGLLDAEDINVIFHDSADALEKAEPTVDDPRYIARARQILERTSRNLARAPGSGHAKGRRSAPS